MTRIKDLLNRLGRSRHDRMLGGVCAGIGDTTDTPAWLWRAVFVLAGLHIGAGVVVYVVLWAVMPVRGDYR